MKYRNSLFLSIMALTAFLYTPTAGFASILLSADSFAVLAGSTVTNTGNSIVNGDIGVWPGTAYTGSGAVIQAGSVYLGGAATGVAGTAQGDLTTAFDSLALMPVTAVLTGQDLGGLTLAPGVYKYASSAQLTGTLFLDSAGFNDVSWVFQVGSGLTTAPNSAVKLINPGSNNGVYWQVGSSATIDTGTAFEGNILADQSITLNTGATLDGRALARIGAVTMQGNTIDNRPGLNGGLVYDQDGHIVPAAPQGSPVVPEPATMLLFGIGGAGVVLMRKRRNA